MAEALPEAEPQGYLALLDKVFATGKPYTAHGAGIVVQAAEGGPAVERIMDFVYQPIRGGDGKVTGIFVVGSDVTDRARADAALRERESQYRELSEQLAEANRLKDEFLAMLSHELRNPLAPIVNAIRILQRIELPANGERAVAMIERQARQAKGHRIEVVVPQGPLTFIADPVRLQQVLENLLSNACKYTPSCGAIRIEGIADDAAIEIRVSDNGIGIPPDKLELVFDLFVQARTWRRRASGRTGDRAVDGQATGRAAWRHGQSGKRRSRQRGDLHRAPAAHDATRDLRLTAGATAATLPDRRTMHCSDGGADSGRTASLFTDRPALARQNRVLGSIGRTCGGRVRWAMLFAAAMGGDGPRRARDGRGRLAERATLADPAARRASAPGGRSAARGSAQQRRRRRLPYRLTRLLAAQRAALRGSRQAASAGAASERSRLRRYPSYLNDSMIRAR